MRTTLLALLLLLPAAGVVNAAWCGKALSDLLRDVPQLATRADLGRFKRAVAQQMYAALAQIGLLGLPTVLFFVGLFSGALAVGDLLYLLLPSGVNLVIGLAFRKLEARVKAIPTATDELRRQRDAVVATWVSKPLPDW